MMSNIRLDPTEQIRQYYTFLWKPVRLLRESKKPRDEGWPERWVSEEEMVAWYESGENVGLQCGGVSDWLCCIDLDSPEAARLAPKFLPKTLMADKEKDGRPSHYIYRSEGADYLKVTDGSSEVLSLKASAEGKGHQFVVEPSIHPTKGAYRWMPAFNPAAVLDIGREKLEEVVRDLALAALLLKHLPQDGRHDYSLSVAGALLQRGFDAARLARIFEVVWSTAGAPKDGLRAAPKNVHDTAERIVSGEPVKADTALNDMVPGLTRSVISAAGLRMFRPIGAEEGQEEDAEKPDDSELASQWLYRHSNIRNSPHGWMLYKNGYWQKIEEGLVSQSITRFLTHAPGVRVTSNKVSSVLRLARELSYVRADRWDHKDDIIVCSNGTLDLNTFELRDHRPEDYAMGGLDFPYDPEAKAEAWEEFIGGRLGEAWSFLQEFAGYALTTDTSHEMALWLLGEGGTGKSTFVEGLVGISGNRAGKLGLADLERSSFALENIVGKTLLTATEQPATFVKQIDVINTLVSGELISINRKNKPIMDVRSTAKLLWAMNEAPKIREHGSGIFRRIQIVKFPPLGGRKNPAVKERIMTLELPGILNWAIEGLKRLRERDRFDVPQSVRVAVEEFAYSNDPVAQFLDDMCERSHEYREGKQRLYDTYSKWCSKTGHKPKNRGSFKEDLDRLGLPEKAVNGKRQFHGVKISNSPEVDVDSF